EVGGLHGIDLDMEVDAVEQRARDPRLVVGRAARRAAAGESWVAEVPTSTRVHCRDQLHSRGIGHMCIGASDVDLARFERLAERVEHGALELGQLVEKQYPQVREADLPGPYAQSATGQRGHAGRMVRRAERAGAADPSAF